MWIDFNETLFKTEDILYVDKCYIAQYGEKFYALIIKTTHIDITKTYGPISRNSEGYAKREKDYETLYKQLKGD